MDTLLWSLVVLTAVTALSFWYIYPDKPWFAMLLCAMTAAAWWLHGAVYILYLLPLVLIVPMVFYFRARTAHNEGEANGVHYILYGIAALPVVLWFAFALRGMPDTLKLRPSDSPPPQATLTEVTADLKLHPEGWILFGPVLLLFAYTIFRGLIARMKAD